MLIRSITYVYLKPPSVGLLQNLTIHNNAPSVCVPKSSANTFQKECPIALLSHRTMQTPPIARRRPHNSMHTHTPERSGPRESELACPKLHPTRSALYPTSLRVPSVFRLQLMTTCSKQLCQCDPPGSFRTSSYQGPISSTLSRLMRRRSNEHRRLQWTNHSSSLLHCVLPGFVGISQSPHPKLARSCQLRQRESCARLPPPRTTGNRTPKPCVRQEPAHTRPSARQIRVESCRVIRTTPTARHVCRSTTRTPHVLLAPDVVCVCMCVCATARVKDLCVCAVPCSMLILCNAYRLVCQSF